jgi:hypothetical protein
LFAIWATGFLAIEGSMRDGAVAQMNMPELLLADNRRAHRTTGLP